MGYLGSWWVDRYRGIEESRNEQAIMAAWSNDLLRIYVIDMPTGYTLVEGRQLVGWSMPFMVHPTKAYLVS